MNGETAKKKTGRNVWSMYVYINIKTYIYIGNIHMCLYKIGDNVTKSIQCL